MSKFELIEPTNTRIELFNDFWYEDDLDDEKYNVELFRGIKVDVKKYTPKRKELRDYGKDDKKIEGFLRNDDIPSFLTAINSIYGTRVRSLNSISITKNELEHISFDDFIKLCKDNCNRYEYSFASKVFSFLSPEKYPIIDSLVTTLIWEYLDDELRNEYPKSRWGKYENYKNAYDVFIKKYLLKKTYKEIDVFLWTYAVLIQNYWINELGVLKFESIPYNP